MGSGVLNNGGGFVGMQFHGWQFLLHLASLGWQFEQDFFLHKGFSLQGIKSFFS